MRSIAEEKVRATREGAFWFRAELAEKAGVDRNTISLIENGGIIRVQPRTVRKIAAAFSVDPVSLVSEGE